MNHSLNYLKTHRKIYMRYNDFLIITRWVGKVPLMDILALQHPQQAVSGQYQVEDFKKDF